MKIWVEEQKASKANLFIPAAIFTGDFMKTVWGAALTSQYLLPR